MSGHWIVAPPVPMIEPVSAQEILIDGIGGIWFDSGTIMLPCYREEAPTEAPHAPLSRVVKVKIFAPICSVPGTIGMLARCLWRRPPHEQPLPVVPTNHQPDPKVRLVR